MDSSERTQAETAGPDGPAHVIIVDADENCRRMYTSMLVHQGYSADAAADCAVAVAAAREGRAQLVVVDPVECNQAELAELQRLASARGIPLVALTSRVTEPELEAVRAEGYGAVLLKPVLPSEVARVVGEALRSRGDSRQR